MKWGKHKVTVTPENLSRREILDLTNSGRDFTLSKKAMVYRASNAEYEHRGRLYVSGLKYDANGYASDIDSIGGTYSKNVYINAYSTKKNLKVAGTKTQLKELLKMQGKDDIAKTITDTTNEHELYDLLRKTDNTTTKMDLDILNKNTPERAEYIKRLVDKGYSVAYDLVDGAQMGYRDLPMIILDSGKSITKKYSTQIWDPEKGWLD